MGEKSTVAKANSKSTSVRTTVPEKIVEQLSIEVGDVLDWEVETRSGRRVAVVKRLQ